MRNVWRKGGGKSGGADGDARSSKKSAAALDSKMPRGPEPTIPCEMREQIEAQVNKKPCSRAACSNAPNAR